MPWILFVLQTEQAIDFLVKVESLTDLELETSDKYSLILSSYAKDLESVKKIYQKQKSDPVIPRNLPPIAGQSLAHLTDVYNPIYHNQAKIS